MSDGDARWDLMIPPITQVNSACSILGSLQYNPDYGLSDLARLKLPDCISVFALFVPTDLYTSPGDPFWPLLAVISGNIE